MTLNIETIKRSPYHGYTYLFLGAIAATGLIITLIPLMTVRSSKSIAWTALGITLIVLSGVALATLFYLSKVDKKKNQIENPNSLLGDVKDEKKKKVFEKLLNKKYNTFIHNTYRQNFTVWLNSDEIDDIAAVMYKYPIYSGSELPYCENYDEVNKVVKDVHDSFLQSGKNHDIIYGTWTFGESGLSKNTMGKLFQSYKEKVKNEKEPGKSTFTAIFNLRGNHYVTLVIGYDSKNEKFRACYCNSFGDPYRDGNGYISEEKDLLNILKQEFFIKPTDIVINKSIQQRNSHDCAIYALENAHEITKIIRSNRSLDEIEAVLKKHVHKNEEQENKWAKEKRIECAKKLINSISNMDNKDLEEKFKNWHEEPTSSRLNSPALISSASTSHHTYNKDFSTKGNF